jgi:arylsulfatase A-like enzyme
VKSGRQPRIRSLLPTLGAGLCVGLLEVLLVAATQLPLFLGAKEFTRFALIAVAVAMSLTAMLASFFAVVARVLRKLAPERMALGVGLLAGLAAAPVSAWLFWELSEGRRVRHHELRPVVVCVSSLLTAAIAMGFALALLRLSRAAPATRRAIFLLLMLSAAAALGTDLLVLRRLYPAFHVALDGLALLFGAAAVAVWPWPPPTSRPFARTLSALGVVAALAAPFWLQSTREAPNLHYAIEQAAPLSGKLLRLLDARGAPLARSSPRAPDVQAPPARSRIALRGDDILLITVDALRADRLRSYGSHIDLTPALDRLADQSVVFTRAYTQTPHTSYALGSLFTGKYLRPVLSLPGASQAHATLPRLLRRYGYRTAAFYPPAVFFVDEERFSSLAEDHFGFEYVKEMFAPADKRVLQLQEYLAQADGRHPLFVWVHLFEPHEPYDPPAAFARGDEPEQRYDGEIAAADAAVADLVRVFRARKPNATVIVTADHGEEFGDHGGYHHGTTLFDEQVRVPLLWSSPGHAPARRVSAAVQLIDLVPTLLAALGIPKDARMRGADLSAILAGAPADPQLRAFASTDELRMWTDGDHKLVCEANRGACRLYDLQTDPSESRDSSADHPALFKQLSSELSDLVASIPDAEALSMQSGDAWPKALARARLGDASAGPDLLPLLGDARVAVRAEAVRAVGEFRVAEALPIVTALEAQDADPLVRDEAALAALCLGAKGLLGRVQQSLLEARTSEPEGLDFARRAAFALLPSEPDPAADIIADLAADSSASKLERERALAALAEAHATNLAPRLIDLLDDVRLRPAVASALGKLGGADAQRALSNALAEERYPEARAAEAAALVALRVRGTKELIVRLLGTETGVPGGLEHWAAVGGGHGRHGYLLDLRGGHRGSALRGTWTCQAARADSAPGCSPGPRASLSFSIGPLAKIETRALLNVWADTSAEWLQAANQTFVLRQGRNELAFPIEVRPGQGYSPAHASSGVRVELIGIVPRTADIPAPAPEPQADEQIDP